VRLIKEEEPSKPSTKISGSLSLPTIAAQRCVDPPQLRRIVRGDLDWIVIKSLEKERSRRYETANGLARDIQRYLSDEVVEARPPSTGYRVRKLVRRNRGLFTAAVLVAFALVVGIAGTTWGLLREAARAEGERLARLDAQEQRGKAVAAAAAEKAANQAAQKCLVQLEKGNEIITSIFTDLDINRVKQGTEPLEAVLSQRLLNAAGQLEGEAVGDPLVVAGLQDRLGRSLLNLGRPEEATALFRKARETRRLILGADHPDTLTSSHNLGEGYLAARKPKEALAIFEETVQLRKAALGPDDPSTLESLNDLGMCQGNLGHKLASMNILKEALRHATAKLGADHPTTLNISDNLASAYGNLGKMDLALPLYEKTVKLKQAKLGVDHPDTLGGMNNLAWAYERAGKRELAQPLWEATVQLKKNRLGANHPDTLLSLSNLGYYYRGSGRNDLAVRLFEETLQQRRARLSNDHPDTLNSMTALAQAYLDLERFDKALPLFEECARRTKAKRGPDHAETNFATQNLAAAYLAAAARQAWSARENEQPEIYRQAIELGTGSNDSVTLERVAKMCSMRPSRDSDRLSRALEFARKAVERGKNHEFLPNFQLALGMSEFRSGHWPEANAALQATMNTVEHNPSIYLIAAFYRAMTVFRQGHVEEGRKLARDAVMKMNQFKPLPQDEKAHHWHDNLIAWMTYKEAEKMLHLGPPPAVPDRLSDHDSDSLALTYLTAAAEQAWLGRDKEYEETCRQALELGRRSSSLATLERAVKVCCLRAGGQATRFADSLELAREAARLCEPRSSLPYFHLAVGMCQFRNANWSEADTSLRKAMVTGGDDFHVRQTAALYRAMTWFQLGKRDAARKMATEVLSKIEPGARHTRIYDHNDLILWIACQEAKDLLEPGSTRSADPSVRKWPPVRPSDPDRAKVHVDARGRRIRRM
jgi:tetratricopeptide (TPR) repeat protein